MYSYVKVFLIGTIDSEINEHSLRQTKNKISVTNFVLNTIDKWDNKEGVVNINQKPHNIVCWGKLAETIVNDYKKGSCVIVEGILTYRTPKNQNDEKIVITEIKATNISKWNQDIGTCGMNHIILLGEIGATPELRYTGNNTSVTNFSINTYNTFFDGDNKLQVRKKWHRIVCWGKIAEEAVKKIKQGDQVIIEGSISYRTNKDNPEKITEIKASHINKLFKGNK